MAAAPYKLTLFSYQVGFGDCFLLRFSYDDRDRHVLIDFGTTGLPHRAERERMTRVARDIRDKCGGKLELVVATHRHADHISGFATSKDGDGPGDIIASLSIDYVVQPWTEAPDEELNSLGPEIETRNALVARQKSLRAMHATSRAALDMLEKKRLGRVPAAVERELRFIGEDNLSNKSAVKNLMRLGRKRFYAYHGMDLPLSEVLPGVVAHVLGPPTLRQSNEIRKQRRTDPDQFWLTAPLRLASEEKVAMGKDRVFPDHPTAPASKLPMETRWFAQRVDVTRAEQMLSLVRALDKQMNNTSLILLFEAGSKTMLFPGDAQIENWNYALHSPLAAKLSNVDLYKVGHHGSLNATPKKMWAAFKKRGRKGKRGRLTSVMSTMPGKHGSEEAHTEVPRATLLRALLAETDLHSTHLSDPGHLYQQVDLELT